jgi:hypothetical protein
MRRSDTTKAIERFLVKHGIKTYRYEWGGKHPRLVVQHGGREVFVTLPGSSCSWRIRHYAVSNLRHALGLVGKEAA